MKTAFLTTTLLSLFTVLTAPSAWGAAIGRFDFGRYLVENPTDHPITTQYNFPLMFRRGEGVTLNELAQMRFELSPEGNPNQRIPMDGAIPIKEDTTQPGHFIILSGRATLTVPPRTRRYYTVSKINQAPSSNFVASPLMTQFLALGGFANNNFFELKLKVPGEALEYTFIPEDESKTNVISKPNSATLSLMRTGRFYRVRNNNLETMPSIIGRLIYTIPRNAEHGRVEIQVGNAIVTEPAERVAVDRITARTRNGLKIRVRDHHLLYGMDQDQYQQNDDINVLWEGQKYKSNFIVDASLINWEAHFALTMEHQNRELNTLKALSEMVPVALPSYQQAKTKNAMGNELAYWPELPPNFDETNVRGQLLRNSHGFCELERNYKHYRNILNKKNEDQTTLSIKTLAPYNYIWGGDMNSSSQGGSQPEFSLGGLQPSMLFAIAAQTTCPLNITQASLARNFVRNIHFITDRQAGEFEYIDFNGQLENLVISGLRPTDYCPKYLVSNPLMDAFKARGTHWNGCPPTQNFYAKYANEITGITTYDAEHFTYSGMLHRYDLMGYESDRLQIDYVARIAHQSWLKDFGQLNLPYDGLNQISTNRGFGRFTKNILSLLPYLEGSTRQKIIAGIAPKLRKGIEFSDRIMRSNVSRGIQNEIIPEYERPLAFVINEGRVSSHQIYKDRFCINQGLSFCETYDKFSDVNNLWTMGFTGELLYRLFKIGIAQPEAEYLAVRFMNSTPYFHPFVIDENGQMVPSVEPANALSMARPHNLLSTRFLSDQEAWYMGVIMLGLSDNLIVQNHPMQSYLQNYVYPHYERFFEQNSERHYVWSLSKYITWMGDARFDPNAP